MITTTLDTGRRRWRLPFAPALLAMFWLPAISVAGAQDIDSPPAYEAIHPELAAPLDSMPHPCPPGSNACPPDGYPEGLVPIDPRRGAPQYLRGWLFRRYAGTYEMQTKLPYPPGYYGNYYFRPWAPGYVRQTPDDFSHGERPRPFYHHVEFYPHEAPHYNEYYEAKRAERELNGERRR